MTVYSTKATNYLPEDSSKTLEKWHLYAVLHRRSVNTSCKFPARKKLEQANFFTHMSTLQNTRPIQISNAINFYGRHYFMFWHTTGTFAMWLQLIVYKINNICKILTGPNFVVCNVKPLLIYRGALTLTYAIAQFALQAPAEVVANGINLVKCCILWHFGHIG